MKAVMLWFHARIRRKLLQDTVLGNRYLFLAMRLEVRAIQAPVSRKFSVCGKRHFEFDRGNNNAKYMNL